MNIATQLTVGGKPQRPIVEQVPPMTVAEQLAAKPGMKALGTVLSLLDPPRPQHPPKATEKLPGGLTRKDF